jgi:hypothetical protein
MGRKKKPEVPEAPPAFKPIDSWEIITEMQINGRNVSPGTELKITGERGRFRFVKFVKTDKGKEWVDVIGKLGFRSFALDRVKTVHYKNKTDENLAVEYKEKKRILKEEKLLE